MRRTLAINAAKWLAKRENRDKVRDKAREFKSYLEKQDDPNATSADNTTPGHKSGQGQTDHHENRPQAGDRK